MMMVTIQLLVSDDDDEASDDDGTTSYAPPPGSLPPNELSDVEEKARYLPIATFQILISENALAFSLGHNFSMIG